MTVGTYIRQQETDARSKFDLVRDHLEFTCRSIQEQFFSKFYKNGNFLNSSDLQVRQTTSDFLEDSSFFDSINIFLPSSTFSNLVGIFETTWKDHMQTRIDWTRGRFAGKIYKIILKDGVILEKTFLTTKGNMITVKRSELGIFVRLLGI